MSKLSWYVKQLFPLTYWTVYEDSRGSHFTIWRMWFGRCFSIVDILFEKPIGEYYSDSPLPEKVGFLDHPDLTSEFTEILNK